MSNLLQLTAAVGLRANPCSVISSPTLSRLCMIAGTAKGYTANTQLLVAPLGMPRPNPRRQRAGPVQGRGGGTEEHLHGGQEAALRHDLPVSHARCVLLELHPACSMESFTWLGTLWGPGGGSQQSLPLPTSCMM